jgi:hypothetical protein
MYQSFDANYEYIENILIQHQGKDRMAHVQHETLQFLVSLLTTFKAASLQLEADTYVNTSACSANKVQLTGSPEHFGFRHS